MPMFQTEIEGGASFPAFFLQQVGVFLAWALWGGMSAEWFALLSGFGPVGRLAEAVGNIVWGLGPAFLLGRMVHSRSASVAYWGRWIWLLPSALFAWAVVSSAYGPRPGEELAELLFPPSGGLAALAVAFLSYPTLGCIGYSLGIASERQKQSDSVIR